MKNKGNGFLFAGFLLIAAALLLSACNLLDGRRAQKDALASLKRLEESMQEGAADKETARREKETADKETEIPDYILNPDMEMPTKMIDGQEYIGVLEIPALELKLPVISRLSYPRLKTAPCRYGGSAYTKDFVIAAHNYPAHFGGLKNLKAGDAVTFTDMDGNLFCYEAAELEVLKPTAVEQMESGDWDLTLFTCTVGGQSRVTVRCEQVRE